MMMKKKKTQSNRIKPTSLSLIDKSTHTHTHTHTHLFRAHARRFRLLPLSVCRNRQFFALSRSFSLYRSWYIPCIGTNLTCYCVCVLLLLPFFSLHSDSFMFVSLFRFFCVCVCGMRFTVSREISVVSGVYTSRYNNIFSIHSEKQTYTRPNERKRRASTAVATTAAANSAVCVSIIPSVQIHA